VTVEEPPVGRRRGHRPAALTRAQVESIRRRRRIKRPKAARPSLVALAAEFGVHPRTIDRALRGVPPYNFGEPVPPIYLSALHRDRGRGRRGLS
jgi:hypothetical protein